VIVHLIDGTYELFRHFYGLRRFSKGADKPFGAVVGVLNTVLETIEGGGTHIGVATDHVIESFRNELWDEYKTGDGIEPALWAQFHPLEEALAAMGVAVWPMIELEADDALASAAALAAADERVQKVCIWTPDKDLAQCVVDDRVVQMDRRAKAIRNAAAVREKFGVDPALIPTISRWSATRPTAIPGSTASARLAPRASSGNTARSKISRRRSWASSASSHSCSRSSRPCAPMLACSPTSTSCAGKARATHSRR
jgi:hypothetical protein